MVKFSKSEFHMVPLKSAKLAGSSIVPFYRGWKMWLVKTFREGIKCRRNFSSARLSSNPLLLHQEFFRHAPDAIISPKKEPWRGWTYNNSITWNVKPLTSSSGNWRFKKRDPRAPQMKKTNKLVYSPLHPGWRFRINVTLINSRTSLHFFCIVAISTWHVFFWHSLKSSHDQPGSRVMK